MMVKQDRPRMESCVSKLDILKFFMKFQLFYFKSANILITALNSISSRHNTFKTISLIPYNTVIYVMAQYLIVKMKLEKKTCKTVYFIKISFLYYLTF